MMKLFAACAVLIFTSCSSTQQQEGDDEMNLGNANAKSESINSAEGEPTKGGNDFAEAEGMNNATDTEFGDSKGGNSLNLGGQSAQAAPANSAILSNPTATNAAKNSSLPANTAAMPSNVAPATDAAAATPTPATPAAPTTGGTVKYVMTSAPVSDQPGGASVGSLEQGDHPLIWEEGQFARMPNGKYVPVNSLSEKGVGRVRAKTSWRHGGE